MKYWACIFLALFISGTHANPSLANDYDLIMMSDIHLGATAPMDVAPSNYDTNNDLDLETFRKLLENINYLISTKEINPKLALILGDLVDHKSSNDLFGTVEIRKALIQNALYYLLELFEKKAIPITYVFGNNDSLSGNYKSFYRSDVTTDDSLYEIAKNNGWTGGFLSNYGKCDATASHTPCITDENQQDGYYVERLAQDLKLIALNSVLFSNRVDCTTSCKSEIEWLKNQLKIAHQNNESVLLAMHVPPGIDLFKSESFWNVDAKNEFLLDLKPYSDTVIGVLTAHTHLEELQLIAFKNMPIIPIIYTAGLSTSHGNLPSFKYLSLRQDPINKKWAIQNYKTYHYRNGKFSMFYDFNSKFCENAETELMSACLQKAAAKNDLNRIIDSFTDLYSAGNPSYKFNIKTESPDIFIIH